MALTIDRAFFARDARVVARALLGCVLTKTTPEGTAAGIIVETEAYLGARDAASHAYRGRTERTGVMFGPAGHAYIYFTYGLHYCFNVVTGGDGVAEAVLIRALEPITGVELMTERRQGAGLHQLTNGPAKLVQALGITRADYGHDLLAPPLTIIGGRRHGPIVTAPRVGITAATDKLWRYYIKTNPYVSRPTSSRTTTPQPPL